MQISGATALAAAELADKARVPGSPSDLTFDDLDGVSHLRSFIQSYPSRAVDNYILSVAADTPQVNTALIIGPLIYGQAQGPCNQRSVQIPELAKATLQRRRGLQVGQGQSRWGDVHIQDLGDLLVRLVDRAVKGSSEGEIWNLNGLYLTGLGETVSLSFPIHAQLQADSSRHLATSRSVWPTQQPRRDGSPAQTSKRYPAMNYPTEWPCMEAMLEASPGEALSTSDGIPSGSMAWRRRYRELSRRRRRRWVLLNS